APGRRGARSLTVRSRRGWTRPWRRGGVGVARGSPETRPCEVDVLSKQVNSSTVAEVDQTVEPMYGSRFASDPVPRFRLPEGELPARAAYQLIHDELSLDATPLLNLASFVTTWMEPEADRLVTEAAAK